MGLDSVELLIAVEGAFGIRFEDEDAARVRTVGDLQDLVMANIERGGPPTCPTSHVFYRLRRSIRGTLGTPRPAIRPAAKLDTLIPRDQRREAWANLSAHSGLPLPDLRRPAWFGWFIGLALLGVFVAATDGLIKGRVTPLEYALVGLAAFGSLWTLFRVTRALATGFAGATLATVTREVVAAGPHSGAQRVAPWSDEEVIDLLRVVVAHQLGVPRDAVTPDARFVEDFGID